MALRPAYRKVRRDSHLALWPLALMLCIGNARAAQPNGQPSRPSPTHPPVARPNHPQQEHLAQWMDRHGSLPLQQQQSALEHEPGFRDLPPQTQQRMRDRLTQLNNMPPAQRQRLLERTEAMEKLAPAERQQVRSAMQQLGTLPVDRRRLVARAFREIREMPVPQRQAVLASDRFRAQFSDQERGTLGSLLAVEPYLPTQKYGPPPSPGEIP